MHKEVRILKSQIYNNKIVKYIVEYIMESGRRERGERAKAYNRLHCIETDNNNGYRCLYL
jgi:ribosomal protein S7